jgi:hypothetical protein
MKRRANYPRNTRPEISNAEIAISAAALQYAKKLINKADFESIIQAQLVIINGLPTPAHHG